MPVNGYNLGIDNSLSLLSPAGTKIDLTGVVSFMSKPNWVKIRHVPMNAPPVGSDIPNGWDGSFGLERKSQQLESIFASAEAQYWAGQDIGNWTLQQFTREVDGTRSSWLYTNVTLSLVSAGTWKGDTSVEQALEFFASLRSMG